MTKLIDLKGKTFGRLFVLSQGRRIKSGNYCWICKCVCGKRVEIISCHLLTGHTKSCGCLRDELASEAATKRFTTHGKRKHKLYQVFLDMKSRCYRKKNKSYKYYGLRGITVCDEWINDFIVFFNFAINNGWKEGLEIDRENNDGNYEPDNCRFVTRMVNNNNKRNSKKGGA